MPRDLPEELRRFILTSVPSVPFVEALLLFRDAPEQTLGTADLARRLYMSEPAAQEIVAQLAGAGIVVVRREAAAGSHRYAPATPELAQRLELLSEYYRTHLLEVTNLIHSTTARRAMQFADAFRLRGDS